MILLNVLGSLRINLFFIVTGEPYCWQIARLKDLKVISLCTYLTWC